MTRIKLEKATRRINIYDYTLIEYAEFLESFWGRRILIETEDKTIGIINLILSREQFPHLIGLDYCFDSERNKNKYVGNEGMDLLKSGSVTIQNLKKNFSKNVKNPENKINISWNKHLLPRIEYLPCFLNKLPLKKVKLYKNAKDPKHKIKGDFLLFKLGEKNYLILSIKNTNNGYVCETFIVNDGLSYCNPDGEIPLKSIRIE